MPILPLWSSVMLESAIAFLVVNLAIRPGVAVLRVEFGSMIPRPCS